MSRLPLWSAGKVAQTFVRLQRGSHIILVKTGEIATLSVPDHEEVPRGTLRSFIRKASLTIEEFLAASD